MKNIISLNELIRAWDNHKKRIWIEDIVLSMAMCMILTDYRYSKLKEGQNETM